MIPFVVLGLIVGAPLVLSVLLRVSAVYLFVGVAAGNLLVQQFASDASLVISGLSRDIDSLLIAQLMLQLLPVALMLLFARRTVSKQAAFLQIVPAAFTSVMLGILTLNILPGTVSDAFYATAIGGQIRQAGGLIIGATALSQLLLIWSTRPKKPRKSRRSKGD